MKGKERWSHRAARMRPQHSRMETDVLLRLAEEQLYPETDRMFCIQSTTPDFYFARSRLAVYLDGEKAHAKRGGRDSRIRELLEKRHGVRVVSVTYRGNSKRERERIVKLILEALK